jgi:hypothetical protein
MTSATVDAAVLKLSQCFVIITGKHFILAPCEKNPLNKILKKNKETRQKGFQNILHL